MPFEKGTTISLGRIPSKETRKKMSDSHKGYKPSDWGAGFKKGNIPWNKRGSVARNAYYAGLIDADGYIAIHANCSRCSKNWERYKRVVVRVSMVEDQALKEGFKQWGGFLVNRKRKGGSDFVEWVLQHGKAEIFIRDIKPFLKNKVRQAEICLKYRQLQTRRRSGTNQISDHEFEFRKKLEIELKSLHLKKGVQK